MILTPAQPEELAGAVLHILEECEGDVHIEPALVLGKPTVGCAVLSLDKRENLVVSVHGAIMSDPYEGGARVGEAVVACDAEGNPASACGAELARLVLAVVAGLDLREPVTLGLTFDEGLGAYVLVRRTAEPAELWAHVVDSRVAP